MIGAARGVIAVGVLLAWPLAAWAQVARPCTVEAGTRTADRIDTRGVAPLWKGNGLEGDVTLQRLAQLGAPAVWFSPREFLLLEGQAPPSPLLADSAGGAVVYFRVRQVRLKDPPAGSRETVIDYEDANTQARVRNVTEPWRCDDPDALSLHQLDRVTIRYYLYYREDRGIGGHFDDLEALELQLRPKVVCETPTSCFDAVIVESVSASAHGVGWYTNVLEVTKTRDTQMPLTVLVEENKHATTPDRDGDGLYMPHYDINRYTNDGWGIRDVAGTGKLGSPAYAAEQSRLLRAFHPEDRVLPAVGLWSGRLADLFAASQTGARSVGAPAVSFQQRHYELRPTWTSRACVDRPLDVPATFRGRIDQDRVKAAAARRREARREGEGDTGAKLIELAAKLDFCRGPEQTRIRSPWFVKFQTVSDIVARIFPGPRNQYGFMRWPQRISGAYRYDGGHGASLTGLTGMEMPVFGGWIVGKANIGFEQLRQFDPGRVSIEALYTPSASRSASWYVSIGREWRYLGVAGVTPDADRSSGTVEELGFKVRFLYEKLRLIHFYGARVAIRADGVRPFANPRLIMEIGAGSW